MKNRILEIGIASKQMTFEGIILPKGAIYGEDIYSPFFCVNYKMRGMASNGRPEMQIFRIRQGKFYPNWEANAVSDAVLDLYFEREAECQIEDKVMGALWQKTAGQGKKLHKLNHVKAWGFKYFDYSLPKGAVYGADDRGIFICKDFSLKGHTGYKNGKPCLKIIRPVFDCPRRKERRNQTAWNASLEGNDTTDAIMRYVKAHNCVIDYGDPAHGIAKAQGLPRKTWNTTPYMGVRGGVNRPATNCVKIVIETGRRRTLETMAETQTAIRKKGIKIKLYDE